MKKLPPLSEMERIEQALLVEKLDEILERIDPEQRRKKFDFLPLL